MKLWAEELHCKWFCCNICKHTTKSYNMTKVHLICRFFYDFSTYAILSHDEKIPYVENFVHQKSCKKYSNSDVVRFSKLVVPSLKIAFSKEVLFGQFYSKSLKKRCCQEMFIKPKQLHLFCCSRDVVRM